MLYTHIVLHQPCPTSTSSQYTFAYTLVVTIHVAVPSCCPTPNWSQYTSADPHAVSTERRAPTFNYTWTLTIHVGLQSTHAVNIQVRVHPRCPTPILSYTHVLTIHISLPQRRPTLTSFYTHVVLYPHRHIHVCLHPRRKYYPTSPDVQPHINVKYKWAYTHIVTIHVCLHQRHQH